MKDGEEQLQAEADEAKGEDQNAGQQAAADQTQPAEGGETAGGQEATVEEGGEQQDVIDGDEDEQIEQAGDDEEDACNDEQIEANNEAEESAGQSQDQEPGLQDEGEQEQAEAEAADETQVESGGQPEDNDDEQAAAEEEQDVEVEGDAEVDVEEGTVDANVAETQEVVEEDEKGDEGQVQVASEQEELNEDVPETDGQGDMEQEVADQDDQEEGQAIENVSSGQVEEQEEEGGVREEQDVQQEDEGGQEGEKEAGEQEAAEEQVEAQNVQDEIVAEEPVQDTEETVVDAEEGQQVTSAEQEVQGETKEAGDAAVSQEAGGDDAVKQEPEAAAEEEGKAEVEQGEEGVEAEGKSSEDQQAVEAESAPQEEQSPAEVTETEMTEAEATQAETTEAEATEPGEGTEAEAEKQEVGAAAEQQEEAGDAQVEEGAGDVQVAKENAGLEGEQLQLTQEQSDLNQSANAPASSAEETSGIPPAPHLPSPQRSHTTIEGQMSTSALNVVWSFGLNRNVPVLNLSDGVREAIMYPCAHVGIMYDFKNNKQHILQAHLNPITCSAVSQDKRWLVTGDVGPDAMVNIWDTYTGTPIQTMFDPNPSGGVVAVALTPDSRYLATLSALPVQTLAIWDWTVDGDVPLCSADLKPEYGLQNFIHFDPTDIHHVVTNSETQVLFYQWEESTMKYYAPPLTDSDFNKPVGRYSQSIFQIGIARALTATSIGNLVVWDNNKPLSKFMDVNQSADKKPLKIIKVHDKGINVLTTTDNYIVLGDTAGHVKFYDQGLRLIYWYADFHTGPCTAISFAHMPDFVPVPAEGQKFPSDATKQAKPFVVRNFVVGTAIAVYGNVNTDGSKFKVIHREHDAAVHALAAHPKLPIIAMGSYSGLLKLWNYRTKETVASRVFDKLHIQTCAFDPKGFYIAIGCTNGAVFLVDSVALLDQLNEPYRYAKDTITHIAFSHNATYLATAEAGCAVTVFKRQRKEGRNPYIWHGRYRSHYKPIKDLTFGIHLDTNEPKLLTLGEDRMLIEYELNHPGKTNHVIPCAEDRIEQSAMTQCMAWYPPITKENFLLAANDQYKLKCYNSVTKMCRKTVLGPTYGSPIRKMMVVPTTGPEDKDRYLAYITDDKVGLHFLPATGNPHLAMALIAHPSGVSNLACSFDGTYLFTAGGPDYAVHMWEINIAALEAQARLGGEDLIPFYGLLEGGRDGEMFAELEDLFYYAQLRHQGINSMETRQIGNRVPISEVPYIMRAMGYYPSEQEIEDMLNEIKYNEYVNLGQYQEDIDLGSFIKLYINHRPAFGLSPEKLLWAFQTLAESPELGKGGFIERGDLLDLLQKKGEHMTEYELAEHLTTLLGFNREGGSCEQEAFDAEGAGSYIAENLPFDINAEVFINEILGFSMTVDPPAPDDTKDVIKSEAP